MGFPNYIFILFIYLVVEENNMFTEKSCFIYMLILSIVATSHPVSETFYIYMKFDGFYNA